MISSIYVLPELGNCIFRSRKINFLLFEIWIIACNL